MPAASAALDIVSRGREPMYTGNVRPLARVVDVRVARVRGATAMNPISGSAAGVPVLALAMGDPAGISPELTARLVADAEVQAAAHLVVFADRRVLDQGAGVAKVALDVDTIGPGEPIPVGSARPVLVDLGHLDPATIRMGEAQEAGGHYALENLKTALAAAVAGVAQAVVFTPFNKSAMRLAYPSYEDEIVFS